MSHELKRSVDMMLKAAEGIGYSNHHHRPASSTAAAGLGGGPYHPSSRENELPAHLDPSAMYSHGELARQLRTCMREIVELRTELAAERESRGQLMQLHAKRVRDEVMVEFRSSQHTAQRDFREFEAVVKQRLTEADSAQSNDRRRIDEALRFTRAHERAQFDAKEEFREAMDELRGRVDSAVALCTSARTEAAQELERERAQLQHRLDLELMRYSELYRKQQGEVEEAKRTMAREVEKVTNTVSGLVDSAWSERMRAMTKEVRDTLEEHHEARERSAKLVGQMQHELQTLSKSTTREIAAVNATTAERLGGIEGAMPVLTSRVERFEQRVEAGVESNTRLGAAVDVLREAVDKASAYSARAQERVQRVEDTTSDRDARISAVEAQCVSLAGVETFRVDLESLKRGVARFDKAVETAVKVAERSERVAEDAQRRGDDAVERAEGTDKRCAKLAARVETAEHRVGSFTDRIVVLEDGSERLVNTVANLDQIRETLAGKVASADKRLSALSERLDGWQSDSRDRVVELEARADTVADVASKADTAAASATQEAARLAKRVAKVESSAFNLSENTQNNKAQLDAVARNVEALTTRHDGLERQASAAHASASKAEAATAEVGRKVGAVADRVDVVAAQCQSAARDAAQALVRGGGDGGGGGGSLGGVTISEVDNAVRDAAARTERKINATIDTNMRGVRDRLATVEDEIRHVRNTSGVSATGTGGGSADVGELKRDVARLDRTAAHHAERIADLSRGVDAVNARMDRQPAQVAATAAAPASVVVEHRKSPSVEPLSRPAMGSALSLKSQPGGAAQPRPESASEVFDIDDADDATPPRPAAAEAAINNSGGGAGDLSPSGYNNTFTLESDSAPGPSHHDGADAGTTTGTAPAASASPSRARPSFGTDDDSTTTPARTSTGSGATGSQARGTPLLTPGGALTQPAAAAAAAHHASAAVEDFDAEDDDDVTPAAAVSAAAKGGSALPPLVPGSQGRPAPSATARHQPSVDPYQTDDSSASLPIAPRRRAVLDTDDSSPGTNTSEAMSPSPTRNANNNKPTPGRGTTFSTSSGDSSSTPVAVDAAAAVPETTSLSRVRPTTQDPFADTPDSSATPAPVVVADDDGASPSRRQLALDDASPGAAATTTKGDDDDFDDWDDDDVALPDQSGSAAAATPSWGVPPRTDSDVTPAAATAMRRGAEMDEVVSASSRGGGVLAGGAAADGGGASPALTQPTSEMTLTLDNVSTMKGGAGSGSNAPPGQEAQQPPVAAAPASAWNFDASDEDEDAGELDDDALAGMM